jgi:phosphopantetheinyl transferase (holo-ACP synthase)
MADHFNQESIEPKYMAKWWACHEAILKAVGHRPAGKITFPINSAPQYAGKERIHLSLTHEGDLVIAIALLGEAECKRLLL